MEERLGVKEVLLPDYRWRISSLGALVKEKKERITQLHQEKLSKQEEKVLIQILQGSTPASYWGIQ